MSKRFDGRNVFRRAVLAFGLSIDEAHTATKAGGITLPRFFVKGWLVKSDHRLYRRDNDLAEQAAVTLFRGLLMAEDMPVSLEIETTGPEDLIRIISELVGYDQAAIHALVILGAQNMMGGMDPGDLEPRDYLDALLEGLILHLKHNRKLPAMP